MAINTIDASTLQKMFIAGAKNLESKKEWINDLNVFPVPDGDTGTNMTMTIMSAVKEVTALDTPTMSGLSKAISSGSLRGARGNSGVILSQLFRGFCKEIATREVIDARGLSMACQKAVETAYKAVMKPKEGTILTVAKGMAVKISEISEDVTDLEELISQVIDEGNAVLARTPEMLPVLKEAGVVDSGGQGLMVVIQGAFDALTGKVTDFDVDVKPARTVAQGGEALGSAIDTVDIKFGYCTEFIVMLEKEFTSKDEFEFKSYLESIGDSIVCVADDELVKIHVHTNDPGLAIQKGLTYGYLTRMKIDNMREEHNERLFQKQEVQQAAKEEQAAPKEPRKPFGFVAVAAGKGIGDIFEGLGADEVIRGGQTMNPSTDDIIKAIDKVNADVVFVLPNNSNIILAAQQSVSLVEDKEIIVIPTKTIPQGITALINFEMSKSKEDNTQDMIDSLTTVKSGQLTYAVRDTSIDGIDIACGDIMGLGDKGILAVGKEVDKTAIEMLGKMVDDESGLVSVYYGGEISDSEADKLREEILENFPDLDVEVQYGGQPVYYYIISVE